MKILIHTDTMSQPLKALSENPFVLAPMAGITDHAFRSFMKELGCSVVITELVSANGIEYKSGRTMKLTSFDEGQRPVGIQLFGEDPECLGLAAKVCEDLGCDFIDLNFGCPVPKVVKKGAGSAMMKDLVLMSKVLSAVKGSVSIPVTIKIRTGWDHSSRNATEVARIAYEEGITWVAIHGRTRAMGYDGQADWDFIAEVKRQSPLPILGNGDLTSPELAVTRLRKSGCDGVMIGRGCLKNPMIFLESMALLRGESLSHLQTDMWPLFLKLKNCVVEHCDERLIPIQLKKFASWFSAGYPGSASFRKELFQTKSQEELMDRAEQFFLNLRGDMQQDTSQEPFLMGGHG